MFSSDFLVVLTLLLLGFFSKKPSGDQLICIFVDHGLLRKGEADQVMDMLGGKFGLNIVKADAAKRFLDKFSWCI